MADAQIPQPPYVLLFEEAVPGAEPLMISMDDRGALPLFGSIEKARAFLGSTNFGPGWRPVEVSGTGLAAVLERSRGRVEYVALDPPPAGERGMKVRMGGVQELIDALEQSLGEHDLFGLGSDGRGS